MFSAPRGWGLGLFVAAEGRSYNSGMEKWRPVVGWEGLYEVSDKGQVRSLDRMSKTPKRSYPVRGKVLRPRLAGSTGAHGQVSLRHGERHQRSYIHQLVLEAFVGPRPPGYVARHLNDQDDNSIENLAWGTASENNHDLVANGKHANANKTHCPKGHPYATRWGKNGGRRCRECEQAREARRKEERMKNRSNEGARG